MRNAIILPLVFATLSVLAADNPERCVVSIGIPTYPSLAQQARIEGTVKVGITVDPAGEVVKATALSGHKMLQPAALENVKTWRFARSEKSSVLIITYNYSVEGQEVNAPGTCPHVKLDLPTRVEISVPPVALQTSTVE